jgi:hypothetical protein
VLLRRCAAVQHCCVAAAQRQKMWVGYPPRHPTAHMARVG